MYRLCKKRQRNESKSLVGKWVTLGVSDMEKVEEEKACSVGNKKRNYKEVAMGVMSIVLFYDECAWALCFVCFYCLSLVTYVLYGAFCDYYNTMASFVASHI